jgi:Tol biopolymer transport system component
MKVCKFIHSIFFFALNIIVTAQSISVVKTQQITFDSQGVFYYPKFSPDGKRLFFSGENLVGINYMDLNNHAINQFNKAYGAGFGFTISPDMKYVYYREDKLWNRKKTSSIIKQSISTKKISYLAKDQKDLSVPQLTSNGNCYFTEGDQLKIVSPQNNSLTNEQIKKLEPIVFVLNKDLILYSNGYRRIINPFGKGNYIWPSLSPDKKKILFTVGGDASYICDLNGAILVKLGWANAPRWSPHGKWIAFMDDRSDGANFKSGDIGVISSDGKKKIMLTAENEIIKLYPEWSLSGDKIAYHTLTGNIFLINLRFIN